MHKDQTISPKDSRRKVALREISPSSVIPPLLIILLGPHAAKSAQI